MEPQFWLDRWTKNDIGFHRDETHDQLVSLWPKLAAPTASTVFVPLCGKSNDMAWLANQGHKVIGVELSQVPIDAFFTAHGLSPESEERDGFKIKRAGPYELWCGDMFDLPMSALKDTAAVYDRASLVALPDDLKQRYATTLIERLPLAAKVLLISLDYDQSEMSGPPFATPLRQIRDLFHADFDIAELETIDALTQNQNLIKRGLTAMTESAYLLTRKS